MRRGTRSPHAAYASAPSLLTGPLPGYHQVAPACSLPTPPTASAPSPSRITAATSRPCKSAKDVRQQCSWEATSGTLVVLNNGIEFAATYFAILLALFFMGAGRYLSADYWIARRFRGATRTRA